MSPLGCRTAPLATPPPAPRSVSTFPPVPNNASRLPGVTAAAAPAKLAPTSRPHDSRPPSRHSTRFRIFIPFCQLAASWAAGGGPRATAAPHHGSGGERPGGRRSGRCGRTVTRPHVAARRRVPSAGNRGNLARPDGTTTRAVAGCAACCQRPGARASPRTAAASSPHRIAGWRWCPGRRVRCPPPEPGSLGPASRMNHSAAWPVFRRRSPSPGRGDHRPPGAGEAITQGSSRCPRRAYRLRG
jgi:hypothetical protein